MKQPEALRLADELEQSVSNAHLYWQGKAAAELRRLHDANQELLHALKNLLAVAEGEGGTEYHAGDIACAAIKKATGAA